MGENEDGGLMIEDGGQDAPHLAPNLGQSIGHLLPSAKKERPECVARAECCFNRQPDGCD
jgi:hypothetical protein